MPQINLVGQTILGYTVEEKINSGASGTVYKVVKKDISGRYVRALKHITIPTEKQYMSVLNSMGGDIAKTNDYFMGMLQDIVSEISILNHLSQKGVPHIVRYYEHTIVPMENPRRYDIYILMEYLTPLQEYVMTHDFSVNDVVTLAEDILEGLKACHENGIMHRDIKDDNIFMSDNGGYKMGDFGVSKILREGSRAESMKGTPNYLAPEVSTGREKYSTSVDLYSLGIVLYRQLNYNRNPFLPPFPQPYSFQDEDAAFAERMSGKIPALPLLGGQAIGRVVVKAISGSRERYQNAAEFLADLKQAVRETDSGILQTSVRIEVTGVQGFSSEKKMPDFQETLGMTGGVSIGGYGEQGDTFAVRGIQNGNRPDLNQAVFGGSMIAPTGFPNSGQGETAENGDPAWRAPGTEETASGGGSVRKPHVMLIAAVIAACLILTTASAFAYTRAQNQKQANKVIDRIETLADQDDMSLNDQVDVNTTRKLYDELTPAQKNLVSNKEDLLGAECVMEQLEKKEEIQRADLTEAQQERQEQILSQQKNEVSRQKTAKKENTAPYSYAVKNPVSWGAYEVTTSSEDLSVRSGPGENYDKMASMPKGTVVYVYGSYNGWYYVNYHGQWGWAKSQYLQPESSAPIIDDLVENDSYQNVEYASSYKGDCHVNAIELNLRSGPGKSYSKICTMKKNDNVQLYGKHDGWYYIEYNGTRGWANGKYLSSGSGKAAEESDSKTVQQPPSYDPLGEYTVATKKDDLNIRTKPKKKAPFVGSIPKGEVVEPSYYDGKWYFVEYNGIEGWVDGGFLKKEKNEEITPSKIDYLGEYYVNANTLTLRTGPGTDYKQILNMHRNDKVDVYGSQSGWYYVEYNGSEGWAKSEFLKKVVEEEPEKEIEEEEPNDDSLNQDSSAADSTYSDDSSSSGESSSIGGSSSTGGSSSSSGNDSGSSEGVFSDDL